MDMLDTKWKQLKSGTDIRGVAVEGVEGQQVNLTPTEVERITHGFVLWMQQKNGDKPLKIAVGNDSRISGPWIREAVLKALERDGVQAICCGLASTPAMFMTTVLIGCDGAIQITASHHPFYRNGLKFFWTYGGLGGTDIVNILEAAQKGDMPEEREGSVEELDFMKIYASKLRERICKEVAAQDYEHPLKGYKIVVDAGNGVGGFYARDVLEPLGADITGSQFLEPDGRFPNHIPNPEAPEAMDAIQKATLENHADLGVIFDTDVDRAGCVDSQGKEINRNRLVALASVIALEKNPGATIVTDSITSSGLKTFIEQELKGKHHRFKRGYKNVIDEAIRLNELDINVPLAIETSGHAALRENFFLDDGAYLMTKIIIKMAKMGAHGKSLTHLIDKLAEPEESTELRFAIRTQRFSEYGLNVIKELEKYAQEHRWRIAPDNYEGIRVSFPKEQGDGWFLLRMSVHDPIMPLNIESDSAGGTKKIAQQLYGFLKGCEELDLTPMVKFLEEE